MSRCGAIAVIAWDGEEGEMRRNPVRLNQAGDLIRGEDQKEGGAM